MRYLFLILLLIAAPAYAAYNPPAGVNRDLQFNNNGQFGGAHVGTGLSLTTTAGVTTLTTSGPAPPTGDFITTETGDPITTETGDNIVTETSP